MNITTVGLYDIDLSAGTDYYNTVTELSVYEMLVSGIYQPNMLGYAALVLASLSFLFLEYCHTRGYFRIYNHERIGENLIFFSNLLFGLSLLIAALSIGEIWAYVLFAFYEFSSLLIAWTKR